MNKERRKTLANIANRVEEALGVLEDAITDLEATRDEEQEYFDAMPESLKSGEKGSIAEEAISNLETAIDAINDILNADVVDAINAATE